MTTAAEEKNGASDVTRARANPPSRKSAEHYWPTAANLRRLSCHVLLSKSRRADPTRLGAQVLRHQLPLCSNASSQGQNRARAPILAGPAPGLFRQRTDYRNRNRQPTHRRFATSSQRPRNPPRTAHDPGTGLGTRQEGKTLRSAPRPPLPLLALC